MIELHNRCTGRPLHATKFVCLLLLFFLRGGGCDTVSVGTGPKTECGARSASKRAHRSLIWQLTERTAFKHQRKTNTCMARACHAPRHPLQNQLSGHRALEVHRAKYIRVEQRQRVDIPAHARTAHSGFPQKSLKEAFC